MLFLYIIMDTLTVLSLNCHGFNTAIESYLKRVTTDVDIILLQETWLSDNNCFKLQHAFNEYVVYHSSAMEDKLHNNILYGRPFERLSLHLGHPYIGRIARSCMQILKFVALPIASRTAVFSLLSSLRLHAV